jgi:hypothetical protein
MPKEPLVVQTKSFLCFLRLFAANPLSLTAVDTEELKAMLEILSPAG